MTAPAASYTRLPQDGAYLGKYVRTLRRTVGSDAVDAHIYATISPQKINGVYYFNSGTPNAIQATAQDGTSTGFLWIQNPSASVAMRIRRLELAFTNATATAIVHDTAPRVAMVRGTFTGAFAGAALTLTKRKTSDAANAGDIRTAVTGATVTVGDVVWSALCPGNDITGPADVFNLRFSSRWDFGDADSTAEDEFVVLAQNECLIVYQLDNGTASDQRLVQFRGIFDEIDVT